MYLFFSLLLLRNKQYKKPYENSTKGRCDKHDNSNDHVLKTAQIKGTKDHSIHKWVYELKLYDNCQEFLSSNLVIIRGESNLIDQLSWKEVKELEMHQIQKAISEVLIIPRSNNGQYYLVKGLNSSLHFSLGTKGVQVLRQHLETCEIVTHIIGSMNNDSIYLPNGIFVKTAVRSKKTSIEHGYYKLMVDMGCHLWGNLLKVTEDSFNIFFICY